MVNEFISYAYVIKSHIKTLKWDFPAGPAAKTALPVQRAQVQPLIRELDPTGHNEEPECLN